MPASRCRGMLAVWIENDLAARFDGRMLDIDRRVADAWGRTTASSRRNGTGLGAMDAFFAATAAAYGLTLVTRNTRHVDRLGVRLHDPWEDG